MDDRFSWHGIRFLDADDDGSTASARVSSTVLRLLVFHEFTDEETLPWTSGLGSCRDAGGMVPPTEDVPSDSSSSSDDSDSSDWLRLKIPR